MAQPSITKTNMKLHPPIPKSDTRHLKSITRLRNTVNRILPNLKTNTPQTKPQHTTHTIIQATGVLQLKDPPKMEDFRLYATESSRRLSTRPTVNLQTPSGKRKTYYKKSPKRYHNNLKTATCLQPNVKDQPNLDAIRDPTTKEITTAPI